MVDLSKLEGFWTEVEALLMQYTTMSEESARTIAQTVEKKIEYLRLFQQGKKIWKKERYW